MEELYPGVVSGTVVCTTGADVGYHDAGHAGDGPVVILVHGTGGRTDTQFFTVFPMLASRHRVIGVDLSPVVRQGAEHLTLDDLIVQVEAVVDERVPGMQLAVVGYSLGSCVAASFAARHPDTVSALVLLNGWAKTDNALRLRFTLWQKLYESGDADALAMFQLLNVYGRAYVNSIPYIGPRPWSHVEQLVADYVVGPGSAEYVQLNAVMDISNLVSAIGARTLVIGSQNDMLIPMEHSHELFGAIASSCLAEIPGGHASVTERPAHLFHLIDRFLREPDAFPAGSTVGDDVVLQLNRP